MISYNDKQVTKNNLTLFATFIVIGNLVENQYFGTPLTGKAQQYTALGLLSGVALHGLLTNKVSCMAMSQLGVRNLGVRQSVYDVVKFLTIFMSRDVLITLLYNKPVTLELFNNRWLLENGSIILGYSVFNLLESHTKNNASLLTKDLIKLSMGGLLSFYSLYGTVSQDNMVRLGGLLAGYTVYHLLTKQLVMKDADPSTCVTDAPVLSDSDDSDDSDCDSDDNLEVDPVAPSASVAPDASVAPVASSDAHPLEHFSHNSRHNKKKERFANDKSSKDNKADREKREKREKADREKREKADREKREKAARDKEEKASNKGKRN
jgi:hypothetical protein